MLLGGSGPPVEGNGTVTQERSELGAAARRGSVTFVGSVASAVLGFVLIIVLARLLGVSASGVVLQAMAVFSIAMSFTKVGLDTTALWLLPRLRGEDPGRIPDALVVLLVPAVLVPTLTVAVWLGVLWLVDGPVLGVDVDAAVSAAAWFLPLGVLTTVTVAGTRAFGGVLPFNLITNVGLPAGRLAAIVVVVTAGGAAVAASMAWAAVFLPAAGLASVILYRGARRATGLREWRRGHWDRALAGRVARYSLPRTVSAAAEQANIWLAVILVGVLAGPAAAGAFGAAARLVRSGIVVSTAVRIAVAPRFSALLGTGETARVQDLYSVTARWVLLFGSPVFVLLGVNAPTVLGWLGAGFDAGATAMVILCAGSVTLLAAGNVQTLLLMSGRSGLSAINRVVLVAVLVLGSWSLVPRMGIEGAAIAWSVANLVDTVLAVIQVRRVTGVSLTVGAVLGVMATVVVCVAGPSIVAVELLGHGTPALIAGGAGSALVLFLACVVGRRPLHLHEFRALLSRSASRP